MNNPLGCTMYPMNPILRASKFVLLLIALIPRAAFWQQATPSWQKQTTNSLARLTSIHFTDAQHGWAAGSNGTLLKTGDGGATWAAPSAA